MIVDTCSNSTIIQDSERKRTFFIDSKKEQLWGSKRAVWALHQIWNIDITQK
jgi:hypothetical protein